MRRALRGILLALAGLLLAVGFSVADHHDRVGGR